MTTPLPREQPLPGNYSLVPAVISIDSNHVTCGTRFAVSAENGDIEPGTQQGFYAHDTRFLSQFAIKVNGKRLRHTGHATFEERIASFYCSSGPLSVVRDRYVSSALHEDISVANHSSKTAEVILEISMNADFADVFEVRRGAVRKTGKVVVEQREGQDLALVYRRGEFERETRIKFSVTPNITERVARFSFRLSPKQVWKTCVDVQPVVDHVHERATCVGDILGSPFGAYEDKTFLGFYEPLDEGTPLEDIPILRTDSTNLEQAYHAAVGDLRALRLRQGTGQYILAAGLPWFMAVFGRDSIISAIQTKLLGPELMIGTLRTLAALQAKTIDVFREAEPGKIIHEVRTGELSLFEDVPHSRYYGSVDSTPLFVILLWIAYQWTGNRSLLEELLPSAELALHWIDTCGDIDKDGFTEYRRRTRKGLRNQGWKDSFDSISFADGELATGPIALAEVQGYVYSAKQSMANIYELLGNRERAVELRNAALRLKELFNDAFWMPGEGFFAIALDGQKRRVDSISSNPGHCLWSGIVAEERASKVVERLMAPDMFNGWGVRTLSSTAARYNPLSYHNGSVWPHDNSIIASGFRRYGFSREAGRIAAAIIEATAVLPSHRLPELFAGYPRRAYAFPVPYPAANAPQAWASGAVIHLLESLIDVSAGKDRLVVSPQAHTNPPFTLEGVRFRGSRQTLP